MEGNALIDFKELREALEDYARDIAERYKEHLIDSGRPTTQNNLINSIKTQVRDVANGRVFYVEMSLLDYWKYIEWGTKPHLPPVSKIIEWVNIKPVIPTPDEKGRIPTPEQLGWMIAKKIEKVGTEGKPDLTRSIEDLNAWYAERFSEALGRDVGDYIHAMFR